MGFFSRLFSKKFSGVYFLALDLGSRSVKSLLFKVGDDGKNVEISRFGEGIKSGVENGLNNNEEIMSETLNAANAAIASAKKGWNKKMPKVILGAAGDLLSGDSITKRYIREDPKEKIDIVELKNIIQKIQWNAWDNIRKSVRNETGYSEFDLKLVNSSIQEIKVDGYRVTNPISFVGREITISTFNAYSTSGQLDFLNAVANGINSELLFIAVEPYAVSQALIRSTDEKINALLLDIGDFATDITFIQESKIKFIKTLALGSSIFNQRISRETGVDYNEAESIKIKYSKNLLSAAVGKKISNALQKDLLIWLNALELSLMNISKQEILPNNIFVYGSGSELPDIKKGLEEGNWRKNLALPRKLEVDPLLPDRFKKVVNLSPEANTVKYTTIIALSLLSLDLAKNEDAIHQNLRRISRIVSR
jgi:cell division protein FtsA